MLGVFIVGLTQLGPGLLAFYPEKEFADYLKLEIALKSLPTLGKEGDCIAVSIREYQAASVIVAVPAFEDTRDQRGTFVAFGVLLSPDVNPTSYQAALKKITETCRNYQMLSVPILKNIVPKLYQLAPTDVLEITDKIKVQITFDVSLTSGQRLRDALKRL